MCLHRLEDHAAHVNQGILLAPGVFVFEVGENARPVVFCFVVRVRMAHIILLSRLLILMLTLRIPLLLVLKVLNLTVTSDDFIDAKLTQAFGASILRSDGGSFDNPWGTWWICACRMSGSQYDLPGGAVGREFVDLLTNEVGC